MDKNEVKERTSIKDFYKKYSIIINCAILSVLFLANCFLSWFTFIAHSFLLALVLICNIKNSISYLFFSLVFSRLSLPYSSILFIFCVGIMMIRLIVLKCKESKDNFAIRKITLILLLVLAIYLFVPFGRTIKFPHFEKAFYVIGIPVLIFLFAKFSEEFNLLKNLKFLLVGLLISCAFSFFRPISEHLQNIIGEFFVQSVRRYSALFVNPNTLATVCEITLSLMSYHIIKNKAQILDSITFLFFFFIGCFTLSKTFMIISSFNLLVLGIFAIKERSKNVGYLFSLFFVGVGIILLIEPRVITVWLGRFLTAKDTIAAGPSSVINHITTGRFDLWLAYLTSFVRTPVSFIYGQGLNAPILLNFSPHNMYISMLYEMGFVGSVLWIATIVLIIKDARKGKQKMSKAYLVPLISLLMLAMVEDLVFFLY